MIGIESDGISEFFRYIGSLPIMEKFSYILPLAFICVNISPAPPLGRIPYFRASCGEFWVNASKLVCIALESSSLRRRIVTLTVLPSGWVISFGFRSFDPLWFGVSGDWIWFSRIASCLDLDSCSKRIAVVNCALGTTAGASLAWAGDGPPRRSRWSLLLLRGNNLWLLFSRITPTLTGVRILVVGVTEFLEA